MDEAGFKAWLEGREIQPKAVSTRMSAVRRIERVMEDLGLPYSDLDEAFDVDRLASVSAAIKALRQDALAGGQAYRSLLPDSETPVGRLANFGSWLGQYRQFRAGDASGNKGADRIRQHALDTYIIPAREEEQAHVAIPVRAVHDALGFTQAWANVCQALTGPKFLEMAEVDAPRTEGPPVSSTTVFHYDLESVPFSQEAVEAALACLGDVIKDDAIKMFAVRLWDGREIAVQRDRPPAQIWVEGHVRAPLADNAEHYAADRGRHSGLTPRLTHRSPYARSVTMVKVSGWSAFQQLTDQYVQSGRHAPHSETQKVASSMPVLSPTNLILYGPPGTGKTFATARESVKLCSPGVDLDDRAAVEAEYRRLVDARQVEFVTFHQSYSYEDFVEGLRPPVSSKDGEGDDEKSGFRLEVSPGVFHRIATRAAASKGSTGKSFDLAGRRIFKMSIGEASNPDDSYLFAEALAEGYTLLGYGELDWSDARFSDRQAIMDAWRRSPPPGVIPTAHSGWVQFHDKFRNSMRRGDLVVISKGNGTFRAIGEVSGDYEFSPRPEGDYAHRRAVNWLWSDASGLPVQELLNDKRFMMKSIYELSRADINLAALERLISTGEEAGGPPEPFVLIIDEINRANISKVFGELITLLEPDKRITPEGGGLQVRLPYSKEAFGVPANLHVIGTMNTADRSIALLDTALRRRFEFRELMPDPNLPELRAASGRCGVDLGKLLRTLNDRIEYLFDREHQIGHAYFIKCASRGDLDAVMRHKVIPLLAEYFYEDWSKVALVLGDADAGEPGRFLERTELKPPAGSDFEGGETRWRWAVRSEFAADAYADFQ